MQFFKRRKAPKWIMLSDEEREAAIERLEKAASAHKFECAADLSAYHRVLSDLKRLGIRQET